MASEAELWFLDNGIPIVEEDLGREHEPDIGGCLGVKEVEGGFLPVLVVRPGLDERRASVIQWAKERIERFSDYGPEPDGWQRRSDGDWQLWARGVHLPEP